MLIYTGCYICLLVMIVFKGRKLIKGRKMDSCAAQGCSLKPAAVATLSPAPTLRGPRGWPVCPSAGWWLKPISSAADSLCALSHIPVPRFPLCRGLGTSFPFPGLSSAHHTPLTAPCCWQPLQELSEGFIHLPLVFRRFQCLTAYSRQT